MIEWISDCDQASQGVVVEGRSVVQRIGDARQLVEGRLGKIEFAAFLCTFLTHITNV